LRQKYWRTQNAEMNTENIHKYLQQQNQAKTHCKNKQNLLRKQNWAELTAKSLKYWRLPKILAYTQNICS